MKTAIAIIIIIVVLAGGAVWYLSRPVVAPSAPTETGTEVGTSASGGVYRINPAESSASFRVKEVLRDVDTIAVGTTSDVAGEIAINATDVSKSTVGLVRVNARTLKTDSAQRDGAISRLILNSEEAANEFIEFRTTSISGITPATQISTGMSFTVTGDLKIKGVTKETTFNVNILSTDENAITGTAVGTVKRSDFGLTIPNVPFVASVEDNVELTLSFVAKKI